MADWHQAVFGALDAHRIRLVATVPDGGLAPLLDQCRESPVVNLVTLSTEEEGVALNAGAWLGGMRGVLMIQSSGVGNCINMLALPAACGMPCLMLVTMRGEAVETNPWQRPMGRAVPAVLNAMGVRCFRPDSAGEVAGRFDEAARHAFEGDGMAAVLVSQQIVGAKTF